MNRITVAQSECEILDCYPVKHATENNCRQVRLLSRVSRLDAHRFYLGKGMQLEAHYFSMNLK